MLGECNICKPSTMIKEILSREKLSEFDGTDASSRASDSSSGSETESESSTSNPETEKSIFYRWKTIDSKITKCKMEMTFDKAVEMLNEELITLKSMYTLSGGSSNPIKTT